MILAWQHIEISKLKLVHFYKNFECRISIITERLYRENMFRFISWVIVLIFWIFFNVDESLSSNEKEITFVIKHFDFQFGEIDISAYFHDGQIQVFIFSSNDKLLFFFYFYSFAAYKSLFWSNLTVALLFTFLQCVSVPVDSSFFEIVKHLFNFFRW